MKVRNVILLPLCLLMMSPASPAEETKKEEVEVQGLWATQEPEKRGIGFPMEGGVKSVRISKDGTKYLIEIVGEMVGEYRTLATREGDQLKVGHLLLGDMIFSDDGQRAYFGGSEFRKVPDHKIREFIENQGLERTREECVMNIRNIQQAVRGHSNMFQLNIGDPLPDSEIHSKDGAEGYMQTPKCPGGGVYTFKNKVPEIGVLYCTCSHGKDKGHVPDDHEDW